MSHDALFEIGVQHLRDHDYDSALDIFQRILHVECDHYGAELNAGVALNNLGYFAEALPYFQASAIKQPCVLIHGNLGICLYRLNRYAEAELAFRKVLAEEPDNALMNYNLAYSLLGQGQYEEGWRLFVWRKQSLLWQHREPFLDQPSWDGHPLHATERLAIFHEQGLGDSFLLSRFLPQVCRRAPNVMLVVPTALHRLFNDIFGLPCYTVTEAPPADYQCSFFDLPAIFGTTLDTIPPAPYLHSDPALAAGWQERLRGLVDRPNVGLVWAGSPRRNTSHVLTDSRRSLAFDQILPFFNADDVNFISLQKGEAIWQARCSDQPLIDWTDELTDFAETAALIEHLDLVITVDTAIVNLAGGMGKPVWLLNRFDSCWRWQPEGTSPWYPTVRDFRQPSWGNWDAVIQRVCAELHLLP